MVGANSLGLQNAWRYCQQGLRCAGAISSIHQGYGGKRRRLLHADASHDPPAEASPRTIEECRF